MRKPAFCICAADQRLCFLYMDSTIPLLSKSKISSLWPSSVTVKLGLFRTWSETPKTGFLTTRLIQLYWVHSSLHHFLIFAQNILWVLVRILVLASTYNLFLAKQKQTTTHNNATISHVTRPFCSCKYGSILNCCGWLKY